MALIKCPECSRDVSDKATTCPSCGYPLRASRILPQSEFSWARTLRTVGFWALLIVGSIVLVQIVGSIVLVQFASSRRQEAVDISYTQFTEQLDKGNVDTVEISERQQVKGSFKTPVPVRGRKFDHFTSLLPFESSDGWAATLRQKGVDVRAREEKQSFGVFVVSILPYLFILALIISMLRRRSGEQTR